MTSPNRRHLTVLSAAEAEVEPSPSRPATIALGLVLGLTLWVPLTLGTLYLIQSGQPSRSLALWLSILCWLEFMLSSALAGGAVTLLQRSRRLGDGILAGGLFALLVAGLPWLADSRFRVVFLVLTSGVVLSTGTLGAALAALLVRRKLRARSAPRPG